MQRSRDWYGVGGTVFSPQCTCLNDFARSPGIATRPCRCRQAASKRVVDASGHAHHASDRSRQRKNAHGIEHIASGAKPGVAAQKHATAGHALMHRRVDTSLYVRGVTGIAGHNTIVKNAGKEKAVEQAVTKEVPATAAAVGAAQLKDPVLLARCARLF